MNPEDLEKGQAELVELMNKLKDSPLLSKDESVEKEAREKAMVKEVK